MRDAVVWVDPGRQGGAPCVMGTRIPTEAVARFFWESGMASTLAAYPAITREQALGACWFSVRFGRKRWRKRWGVWADRYGARMWSGDWEDVPEPPREAAGADLAGEQAGSGVVGLESGREGA